MIISLTLIRRFCIYEFWHVGRQRRLDWRSDLLAWLVGIVPSVWWCSGFGQCAIGSPAWICSVCSSDDDSQPAASSINVILQGALAKDFSQAVNQGVSVLNQEVNVYEVQQQASQPPTSSERNGNLFGVIKFIRTTRAEGSSGVLPLLKERAAGEERRFYLLIWRSWRWRRVWTVAALLLNLIYSFSYLPSLFLWFVSLNTPCC